VRTTGSDGKFPSLKKRGGSFHRGEGVLKEPEKCRRSESARGENSMGGEIRRKGRAKKDGGNSLLRPPKACRQLLTFITEGAKLGKASKRLMNSEERFSTKKDASDSAMKEERLGQARLRGAGTQTKPRLLILRNKSLVTLAPTSGRRKRLKTDGGAASETNYQFDRIFARCSSSRNR